MSVTMPQPVPDLALNWKLEATSSSIAENEKVVAVFLTDYDRSTCIGSSCYQLRLDMIATESGHESCLATLYFKDSVEGLQIWVTEQLLLPSTEKAENVGSRAWLINSAASACALIESDTESTTSSEL